MMQDYQNISKTAFDAVKIGQIKRLLKLCVKINYFFMLPEDLCLIFLNQVQHKDRESGRHWS